MRMFGRSFCCSFYHQRLMVYKRILSINSNCSSKYLHTTNRHFDLSVIIFLLTRHLKIYIIEYNSRKISYLYLMMCKKVTNREIYWYAMHYVSLFDPPCRKLFLFRRRRFTRPMSHTFMTIHRRWNGNNAGKGRTFFHHFHVIYTWRKYLPVKRYTCSIVIYILFEVMQHCDIILWLFVFKGFLSKVSSVMNLY